MFLFYLVFAMSLCASVYMCFGVTCWERADLLALVCGVYYEFVTFLLVSWVRCGTWLYRFLIFAPLLTFSNNLDTLVFSNNKPISYVKVYTNSFTCNRYCRRVYTKRCFCNRYCQHHSTECCICYHDFECFYIKCCFAWTRRKYTIVV